MSAPTTRGLDRDLIDGATTLWLDALDVDAALDQRLPWDAPAPALPVFCPCCREPRAAGEMEPHGIGCLYCSIGGAR